MLELLFLLLPLAALYGYIMGSRAATNNSENKKSRKLNNLTRGINYFLRKDRDAAVEEFINLYDNDGEHTFEEGLALANLFRERGEIERAIKFHNNLLSMEGLEPANRSTVLLELANDFMKAGVLSKAEEILLELISFNSERLRAVKLLVKLYQLEKDWNKALNVINNYRGLLQGKLDMQEAEFLCEIAQEAYNYKDFNKVKDILEKAISTYDKCSRAYILLTKVYIEQNINDKAIELLNKLITVDPENASIAVEELNKINLDENKLIKLDILLKWLEQTHSVTVKLAIADIMLAQKDDEKASEFLVNQINSEPHVKLFAKLFDIRMSELPVVEQEKLQDLKEMVDAYGYRKALYQCKVCGFRTKVHFWNCPSCHTWESLKPNNDIVKEKRY